MTKGELAKQVLQKRYPDGRYQYDHALPQGWVDEMRSEGWTFEAGNFVWIYDEQSMFGRPEPLTAAGALMLEVIKNG
jgi:hypothetical protein